MFFKISLFLFMLSAVSGSALSTKKNYSAPADSLKIGSEYKVTGIDGSKFEGILIAQDSSRIIFKNKSIKELSILREQVKKIQDSGGKIIYQAYEVSEEELYETGEGHLTRFDSSEICMIKLNSGNILKDVRIIDSDDSTFTVTKDRFNKTFKITGINSVQFEQHKFWPGFAYGGAASMLFWGAYGLLLSHNGEGASYGFLFGVLLAVPTGLVAGLISEFSGSNQIYNFYDAGTSAKVKRLRYIREKHKD